MSMPSHRGHQGGFSLVELMVALVVALVLLAGILQILLSNRESFGAQQALAGLQENSRLASFVIENVVAHAGYRVDLASRENFLFPASEGAGFVLNSGAVVASKQGGTDESDAVRLRFQGDGGVHDCLGSPVGSPTNPVIGDIGLYVSYSSSSKSPALYCAVYSAPDTTPQALVDHVERFKVRYGLDTDGDGAVDAYTGTLTPAQENDVRSLRIQLLLTTKDNVLPSAIEQDFTFADGSSFTRTDRHARELVDQTVALRNLLP